MSKLSSKNFGLFEDQFIVLLCRACLGDTTLLKIIFECHYDISISYLIKYLKLNEDDAMDAFMTALLLFWEKILQSKIKYGNLAFLLTKMAFQVHIKSKMHDKKLDLTILKNMSVDINDEYCEECIKKAFLKLNEADKKLLLSYYVEEIPLVDYAKKEKVNEVTIRKRKQRAADQLKQKFFKIFEPEK